MVAATRHDGASSRARILAAVQADPGIHVSLLAARTGLSWNATRYHLQLLERRRLVQVDKEDRERRAFPAGLPATRRTWLTALRDGEAAEVLRLLQQDPRQTIPALSRQTGSSVKVVRRQVANLVHVGLLNRRGRFRPVYEVSRAAETSLAEWMRRREPAGSPQQWPSRDARGEARASVGSP